MNYEDDIGRFVGQSVTPQSVCGLRHLQSPHRRLSRMQLVTTSVSGVMSPLQSDKA